MSSDAPDTSQLKNSATSIFKVGSFLWLLRHELRLYFYEKSSSKPNKKTSSRRGLSATSILGIGIIQVLLHIAAWAILRLIPAGAEHYPAKLTIILGIVLYGLFTLLLSTALSRSVSALFERGDLDLLLSSPIPSKTIFEVRIIGIATGVSLVFLFFFSPFAHVGLVLGQLHWLSIYPSLFSLSLISAALAMWMTLSLVRWIGVRKTRVVAQLLSALVGAVFFLFSQLWGNLGKSVRDGMASKLLPLFEEGGVLSPESWLWLPSKALLGSPLALLILAAIAALSFVLVSRRLHRFFVIGVQQSSAAVGPKSDAAALRDSGQHKQFTKGLFRNVILKEWRIIARDPQLISQVGLQILYMLPLFFVIFRKGDFAPSAAAGMTMLAALLASSLIWIMICGEQAADLLVTSPSSTKTIRRAKVIAASSPALLLIIGPLIYLAFSNWWSAVATLLGSVVAMHNISLINLWMARPADRSDFQRRANGSVGLSILEKLNSVAWAGAVYLGIVFGWWSLVAVFFALVSLLLAWVFKIEH